MSEVRDFIRDTTPCHFWGEPVAWAGDKVLNVMFAGRGGPLLIHKGPDFCLIKSCRWTSGRTSTTEAAGKGPETPNSCE